ncbi:MAG: carbohydrate ABC transporter permease [Bariatricus sp.]
MKKNSAAAAFTFLFPAFVCLILFNFLPVIRNVILSFTSWDMVVGDPKFIGLRNYKELFMSRDFINSILVTIRYTVMFVPSVIIIGFLLASLLVKKSVANVIYRTIFFSPYVTSMVAMSAVFLFIYHPQYGTLNNILKCLGIPAVQWLGKKTALISLVAMNCWKTVGFCAVVYLGALLNVSDELKEAADIDGAGRLQKLWMVEVPLVSPTTFMLIITVTIESFKVFTQINVMTGGGPDASTTNMLTYMFQQAFEQFRVGYGGAVAVIMLLTVLAINFVQMAFEKYVNYDV